MAIDPNLRDLLIAQASDQPLVELDTHFSFLSCGYIVPDDQGRWHLLAKEHDQVEPLPEFIRNADDARAFILEADRWMQRGFTAGQDDYKESERATRRWLRNYG